MDADLGGEMPMVIKRTHALIDLVDENEENEVPTLSKKSSVALNDLMIMTACWNDVPKNFRASTKHWWSPFSQGSLVICTSRERRLTHW